MRALTLSLAAASTVVIAAPALAHHSYGMFDQTTDKTVVGTVDTFDWTNPHSHIRVLVPDASGANVAWSIEIGPPGQLARTGWKRNTLKPGDKVEVMIHPLRDGAPGGHLMQVKAADGKFYYDSVFRPKGAKLPITP